MKDSTEDKVISVTSFEGPNSPILFLETVDNKDVESIQEATTEEASDANNNQAADHKIEDEVIPMKDSDSASQLNYKKAGTTDKGKCRQCPKNLSKKQEASRCKNQMPSKASNKLQCSKVTARNLRKF
ncbi:hypothetical protein Dimus_013202 [Dionaea muscipula]